MTDDSISEDVIKGVNHGHDDSISEDVIKGLNHGHDDSIPYVKNKKFVEANIWCWNQYCTWPACRYPSNFIIKVPWTWIRPIFFHWRMFWIGPVLFHRGILFSTHCLLFFNSHFYILPAYEMLYVYLVLNFHVNLNSNQKQTLLGKIK